VFSYCDVIFGNELEVQTWARATSQPETNDVIVVAKALAALPQNNKKRPRIVVVTRGTQPTILVSNDDLSNPKFYPVPTVTDDEIVDVNGVGDAFAGGFLGTLMKGQTAEEAILVGQQVAAAALQQASPTNSCRMWQANEI
jgi:adenosine kinase